MNEIRLSREERELIAAIERAFDEGTFLRLVGGGEHAASGHVDRSMEQMIDRLFRDGRSISTFSDRDEMCASIEWLLLQDKQSKRDFLDAWEGAEPDERIHVYGFVPGLQAPALRFDKHSVLEYGTTAHVHAVFAKDPDVDPFGMALVTCFPDGNRASYRADPRLPEILRATETYRTGTPARRISMELSFHPVQGLQSITYDDYRQAATVVVADRNLDRVLSIDDSGILMDTYQMTPEGRVSSCLERGRDVSDVSSLRPYLANGGMFGPALLSVVTTYVEMKEAPVLSSDEERYEPIRTETLARIARDTATRELKRADAASVWIERVRPERADSPMPYGR